MDTSEQHATIPASVDAPFWQTRTLEEMTPAQWEQLCDGCAKCCLEKLEDLSTGEIAYTDVGCHLLDVQTCRCTNYENRQRFVPDCVRLTPHKVRTLPWLPSTCAYRLLAEGKPLPQWHPLISGDENSVHRARKSVRGRAVSATDAGDLEQHIVRWPK